MKKRVHRGSGATRGGQGTSGEEGRFIGVSEEVEVGGVRRVKKEKATGFSTTSSWTERRRLASVMEGTTRGW